MKKSLLLPAFAAVVFAIACEDGPTETGTEPPIPTTPTVPIEASTQSTIRFVNAIPGLSTDIGFKVRNTFLTGSGVSFGEVSSWCTTISAGEVPIAFGTVNATSTDLSGNPMITSTQNLRAGGEFTLKAGGTPSAPQLFVLNKDFSGSVGANQVPLRFLNLVPNGRFDVFIGSNPTATVYDLAFSATSPFTVVPEGNITFRFRDAAGTEVTLPTNLFYLNRETTNTLAILPTAAGGFVLRNLVDCRLQGYQASRRIEPEDGAVKIESAPANDPARHTQRSA